MKELTVEQLEENWNKLIQIIKELILKKNVYKKTRTVYIKKNNININININK